MECENCGWDYPFGYVQTLVSSEGNLKCCGICAFEIINRIHGITREKFDGEAAEKMRLNAIAWRASHPRR